MTDGPRAGTETPGRTGATPEELKQHARAVKEDLLDLGRATKDVARDKLGDAKHIAVEYYDEGKHKSAEYYKHGKQTMTEVEDRVEKYIREKPLQTVAMAAAGGMLLGFLLKRR